MTNDQLLRDIASVIAKDAHEGRFYGDAPYFTHLEQVVRVCDYFSLGNEIAAACWLHDVLEDCDDSFCLLIAKEFEGKIFSAVWGVSDEPGENRKERKAKTYAKTDANPDAVLVKLCDRIANVMASKNNSPSLFKMYREEHPEFMDKLHIMQRGGKFAEMGIFLENLFSDNK